MNKNVGRIAATAIAFTGVAIAQNSVRPSAGKIQFTDSQIAATNSYWTPERLANAKPLPLPKVDRSLAAIMANASPIASEPKMSGKGGLPSVKLTPENESSEPIRLNQGDEEMTELSGIQPEGFNYVMPFSNHRVPALNYPYSTVGKIFFFVPAGASEPSGEYVCSGAVALNNHTVLTARHCMYDVNTHVWYSNWIFYPAYNNGPNAAYHNGWTIRKASTWTGGSWDYDIGFLQLNDDRGYGCNGSSGGYPIGAYTGWLGYAYGGDYSQRQWDVFGYPQAAPFNGSYQYDDEAATGVLNPLGAANIVEIGNPQTGGTSGGPWVLGLDPEAQADPVPTNNVWPTLTNLANGLNSFKWTNPNQPEAINGPAFFQYNFWNLYVYYVGQSCP
ncbi:MAG: trypsin-like serine protease [Acidobacteriaceae bacterium]|nr:trypsin-like serine protease [Acidobacteriaceae bacterium]